MEGAESPRSSIYSLAPSTALDGPPQIPRNFTKRAPQASTESRFDLHASKARVFKLLEESATSKFRNFYKTELMDRFLQTTILYFVSLFQREAIRLRCAKAGGVDAADQKALEATGVEAEEHLNDLAPIYSLIIMSQSEYQHAQQDKLFFEALYEATHQILKDAFSGQRNVAEVETELGRIFRTDYFNLARRKAQKLKASNPNMTIRELYALRHEGDAQLNSKILKEIDRRREHQSVQAAVNTCSPILANVLPNPHALHVHHSPAQSPTEKSRVHGGLATGGLGFASPAIGFEDPGLLTKRSNG